MAETLEYSEGGITFQAHVALPEGGDRRPAVLVAHAFTGQCDFERGRADALARLGYVGVALDVYGKGKQNLTQEQAGPECGALQTDRALLLRRLRAGVDAVRNHARVDGGRIAAIGYCFGGLSVLDLARGNAPLRGVVSFHGVFTPPNLGPQAPISPKILVLHGWDDPWAKPEAVVDLARELTDAKADWQIHAYGHAGHAFTDRAVAKTDGGFGHDEPADRRSWRAATDFLVEILG